MNLYERIKALADAQKISIRRLEENIGFGNGTINRWRKTTPGVDKLSKVADYFHVSIDYLMDRTDDNNSFKTDMTIEEALDSVMSYDGKPITDNDREVLRGIIEGYLNTKKG